MNALPSLFAAAAGPPRFRFPSAATLLAARGGQLLRRAALVLLPLLGGALSPVQAQGTVSFSTTTQPARPFPNTVREVIADLNQDGHPDVLFIDPNTNALAVHLGSGTRTFPPQPQRLLLPGMSLDEHLRDVAAADLNADGVPELILASSGGAAGNVVRVFRQFNNNIFDYRLVRTENLPAVPRNVLIADITSEGRPDLLVTCGGTFDFLVARPQSPTPFVFFSGATMGVATGTGAMVAGDIDGDNIAEIIACTSGNQNNVVTILAHGSTSSFTVGTRPMGMALGDIDQDGDRDLLIACRDGQVSVRLNDGQGLFTAAPDLLMGTSPTDVALTDLNQDGLLDVLAISANGSTDQLALRLGSGGGAFGALSSTALADGATQLRLADFDHDNVADFAVANQTDTDVTVGFGRTAGGFTNLRHLESPLRIHLDGMAVANLTPDTRPDVVALDHYNPAISFHVANPSQRGFMTPRRLHLTDVGSNETLFCLAVGDVNNDGVPELAVGSKVGATGGTVRVYEHVTGGDIEDYQLRATVPVAGTPLTILIADLQNAGRPGLVVSTLNSGGSQISLRYQMGSNFNFGNHSEILVADGALDLSAADVDRDGDLDLVTHNGTANTNTATVLINLAAGIFFTPRPIPIGPSAAGIVLSDVDQDGDPDLLLTSQGATPARRQVLVRLNDGAGNFTPAPDVAMSTSPFDVTLHDMNRDGIPDLLSSGPRALGSEVGLRLGLGGGQFGPLMLTPIEAGAQKVLATNFDLDAAADFVVGHLADVAPSPGEGAVHISVGFGSVTAAPTWTGAVSTDWNTSGNWSNGLVPNQLDDVTIPAGAPRYPVLTGSGTFSARVLVVDLGARLTLQSGTLELRSTTSIHGTFAHEGGLVHFAGPEQQLLFGSVLISLRDVTVGPAGLQLLSPLRVQRVLTLQGTLASGGMLTLASSSQETALVVNNGGFTTGNVTVQRFIDGGLNTGPGYRHYSPPVASATVGGLTGQAFSPVVNPAYNTASVPGNVTPFPTVFSYDQNRVTGSGHPGSQDFDRGFVSPAALSEVMPIGKGLVVHAAAGQTLSVAGLLNNGDFARGGLLRGTQTESGWHLLGNPYPAPLNLEQLQTTGMDAAVYTFASTGPYAGTYQSFVRGIGAANPVVAQGQAFWLRTSVPNTAGSVTFTNAARLTTFASPVYHRPATDTRPLVQLTLSGATTAPDALYVYLEQGATPGFDAAFDAYKLPATDRPYLAARAGTAALSISGLPLLGTAEAVVPLEVRVPVAGTYTLEAAALSNLPAGATAHLRDLQTGALIDLARQPRYTVTLSAAAAGPRFELVLRPGQVTATTPAPATLAEQVSVFPNPAHGYLVVQVPSLFYNEAKTIMLLNSLGQAVQSISWPAGSTSYTLSLQGVTPGVYGLRVGTTSAGSVTKRLVVD